MLLADSPHVNFLEQYLELGAAVFQRKNFEQTPYFKNAVDCIRFTVGYFQHRTLDGLLQQARSFVTLYERMMRADSSEVKYRAPQVHSDPGSLPVVLKTWTPNTV